MIRHRLPPIVGIVAAAGMVALLAPACRAPGPQPEPAVRHRTAPWPLPETIRGVWVARFHYRGPDDIRTIITNCAKLGCNTVFWQVRGEGTVAYPSRLEPWAREYDFRDPGFDPLAIAVQAAHEHHLRIEAWINVMPGWKGPTVPPVPEQLYHAHADWFVQDAQGRRQPLATLDRASGVQQAAYVIVNPCLPEVRNHITRVVDEIVSRYNVDGVHLDYIRYAWDNLPGARSQYPRDTRTLQLYRAATGNTPERDPAAWDHWRANQLTRLVSQIRSVVDARRPGATVTAAVWRDPNLGYREYLQNSVVWLRTGLVDAVMPMAYTADLRQLEADIGTYHRLVGARRVVPGIGLYKHAEAVQTEGQLERCAAWGGDVALFSYDSLFPTIGDLKSDPQTRARNDELRRMRRAIVERCFRG